MCVPPKNQYQTLNLSMWPGWLENRGTPPLLDHTRPHGGHPLAKQLIPYIDEDKELLLTTLVRWLWSSVGGGLIWKPPSPTLCE